MATVRLLVPAVESNRSTNGIVRGRIHQECERDVGSEGLLDRRSSCQREHGSFLNWYYLGLVDNLFSE